MPTPLCKYRTGGRRCPIGPSPLLPPHHGSDWMLFQLSLWATLPSQIYPLCMTNLPSYCERKKTFTITCRRDRRPHTTANSNSSKPCSLCGCMLGMVPESSQALEGQTARDTHTRTKLMLSAWRPWERNPGGPQKDEHQVGPCRTRPELRTGTQVSQLLWVIWSKMG